MLPQTFVNASGVPTPVKLNSDGSVPTSGSTSSTSGPSTAVVTSVNDSASSTTLIVANTAAKERIIYNNSSSVLYVKLGTTASATDFTQKLFQDDSMSTTYTGRIDGIWASDSTGAALITELT